MIWTVPGHHTAGLLLKRLLQCPIVVNSWDIYIWSRSWSCTTSSRYPLPSQSKLGQIFELTDCLGLISGWCATIAHILLRAVDRFLIVPVVCDAALWVVLQVRLRRLHTSFTATENATLLVFYSKLDFGRIRVIWIYNNLAMLLNAFVVHSINGLEVGVILEPKSEMSLHLNLLHRARVNNLNVDCGVLPWHHLLRALFFRMDGFLIDLGRYFSRLW